MGDGSVSVMYERPRPGVTLSFVSPPASCFVRFRWRQQLWYSCTPCYFGCECRPPPLTPSHLIVQVAAVIAVLLLTLPLLL